MELENLIFYLLPFVGIWWLTSISIEFAKLLKIWLEYKLQNIKEYSLWD